MYIAYCQPALASGGFDAGPDGCIPAFHLVFAAQTERSAIQLFRRSFTVQVLRRVTEATNMPGFTYLCCPAKWSEILRFRAGISSERCFPWTATLGRRQIVLQIGIPKYLVYL